MIFALASSALLLATMLHAHPLFTDDHDLVRVRNSFVVMVKASYAETATLFSPVGERAWAGRDWDPQFLFPRPERDEEGAVFTVSHGSTRSVWLNSLRNLEAKHFQYVYFVADKMVTVIDVHFTTLDSESTKVEVTYTRTALTPEANAHVRALGEHDRGSGPEWQRQIDDCLSSRSVKR